MMEINEKWQTKMQKQNDKKLQKNDVDE